MTGVSRDLQLVIPAAGKSSRFGLDRPKFLLQHPSGVTMLEKAILGLQDLAKTAEISKIVIVSTEGHFSSIKAAPMVENLERLTQKEVGVFFLPRQTESVVQTLTEYLQQLDVDDGIIVKDSDNLVDVPLDEFVGFDNALAFSDLRAFPRVSAPSKSFLELGNSNVVTNFVEKRVISSLFSVGMTKFANASDILESAESLKTVSRELYVSDLVRNQMLNGKSFHGVEATRYEDWGTLEDWLEYVRTYKTLFLDLDGVVLRNGGRFSSSLDWASFEPIAENVEYLLELQSSARVALVFTTSRSNEFRDSILRGLENLGFANPVVVTDLPHAQRVLVNDFATTNPYPSAVAISLERESVRLREFLESLF